MSSKNTEKAKHEPFRNLRMGRRLSRLIMLAGVVGFSWAILNQYGTIDAFSGVFRLMRKLQWINIVTEEYFEYASGIAPLCEELDDLSHMRLAYSTNYMTNYRQRGSSPFVSDVMLSTLDGQQSCFLTLDLKDDYHVEWRADGLEIIYGGRSGRVQVFDVITRQTREIPLEQPPYSSGFWAMEISPNFDYFIVQRIAEDPHNNIIVIDKQGHVEFSLDMVNNYNPVFLDWNPSNNTLLITNWRDRVLSLVPINDPLASVSVPTNDIYINDVNWSPNGQWISILGTNDIKIISLDGLVLHTIDKQGSSRNRRATSVEWVSNEEVLVVYQDHNLSQNNNTVIIYNILTDGVTEFTLPVNGTINDISVLAIP